jgi:peptide/nickel transport system permease protein
MNEPLLTKDRAVERPVEHSPSTWRLAWRRFRRHKLAIVGSVVILVLMLGAVLAPWLTPYDITDYNLQKLFGPPSLTVPEDPLLAGPCIRPAVLFWKCGMHPFGTDDLGRDILSRVLHGGRVSLLVGFVAAIASTLLGSALGALAAYFAGRLDTLISRFTDIMLSIPTFPLLLILTGLLANRDLPLSAYLSDVLGPAKSIVIIITVIVALSWDGDDAPRPRGDPQPARARIHRCRSALSALPILGLSCIICFPIPFT